MDCPLPGTVERDLFGFGNEASIGLQSKYLFGYPGLYPSGQGIGKPVCCLGRGVEDAECLVVIGFGWFCLAGGADAGAE